MTCRIMSSHTFFRERNGTNITNEQSATCSPSYGATSSKDDQSGNFSTKVSTHNPCHEQWSKWRVPQVAQNETQSHITEPLRRFGRNSHGQQGQYKHHNRKYYQKYENSMKFSDLIRLSVETTEPSDIVCSLDVSNLGLAKFLQENASNNDCLELVIVILGQFCLRGGVTTFRESFIEMIKMLETGNVFKKIGGILLELPHSKNQNLPPVPQRIERFLTSVYYLSENILSILPSYSSNVLGEDFSQSILKLKPLLGIYDPVVFRAFELFEKLSTSKDLPVAGQNEVDVFDNTTIIRDNTLSGKAVCDRPTDNFRMLNVVPGKEDICNRRKPFLRKNIISGPYPDVNTYLDIQFRLLQEDFFCPLRKGLTAFKEITFEKQRNDKVDDVYFYYGVKVVERDLLMNQYTLEFHMEDMGHVDWDLSKRFLYGSLLCLSPDNFDSLFLFTVIERNIKLLSEGKINVSHEGKSALPIIKNQIYVMAESVAYFEAYRGVLEALQRMSPSDFPLVDYILCRDLNCRLPDYLAASEMPVYNLTPISLPLLSDEVERLNLNHCSALESPEGRMLSCVSILDLSVRPSAEDLLFDPSQEEAFFAALTQKVALIQGPPGTGKTYLGLRIVQALIQNKEYWHSSTESAPIIVVCYTNHALDHFLNGITNFTDKVVRIGGQSKHPHMEKFTLKEWRRKTMEITGRSRKLRDWMPRIQNEMRLISREFNAIQNIIKKIRNGGIVHEDTLYEFNVIREDIIEKLQKKRNTKECQTATIFTKHGSVLPIWLGFHSEKNMATVLEFFQHLIRQPQENIFHVGNAVADRGQKSNLEDRQDANDVDDGQVSAIGQRIMEDIFVLNSDCVNSCVEDSVDGRTVYFGFLLDILTEYINKMEQTLREPTGKDEELARHGKKLCYLKKLAITIPILLDRLSREEEYAEDLLYIHDIFKLSMPSRWLLYSYWKNRFLDILEGKNVELKKKYLEKHSLHMSVETEENAEICRGALVVGVTTSGAAKQRALLNHLESKIVIVEEAAEILEAHITVSLSKKCQHLILIGDHKQLKPPTTVYHLAKKYHLDVSLFERLVNNGMKPHTLQMQHRMRPEIARLIVPDIYPELHNHNSVLRFPRIKGIKHNLFFLTHKAHEKMEHEGRSHVNYYEAEMALNLAKHLLLQGYHASQITILTTYSGQLLHMKRLRNDVHVLNNVRIAVVDNFQGEESDIVILSLVRSNIEENVGFLRVENRICVSLSRARQGFYLIGNMDVLQEKSKLWNGIKRKLEENGEFGNELSLFCEFHHVITKVVHPSEFPPEGGCHKKCDFRMKCGHLCSKICHVTNTGHVLKCTDRCDRRCSYGHPCFKQCYEECFPCKEKVSRTLPCEHTMTVECHQNSMELYCAYQVVKELPFCGHKLEMDCGKSPNEVECPYNRKCIR